MIATVLIGTVSKSVHEGRRKRRGNKHEKSNNEGWSEGVQQERDGRKNN